MRMINIKPKTTIAIATTIIFQRRIGMLPITSNAPRFIPIAGGEVPYSALSAAGPGTKPREIGSMLAQLVLLVLLHNELLDAIEQHLRDVDTARAVHRYARRGIILTVDAVR